MHTRLLIFSIGFLFSAHAHSGDGGQPVAEIFGQKLYAADLMAPGAIAPDTAGTERTRGPRLDTIGKALRARVWQAVFDDYARTRALAPTEAEIVSQIEGQRRMKARSDAERARQREALVVELKSPSVSEKRRKQARQHLDLLIKLAEFDAKREAELRDPAMHKIQLESERRVAEHWVRQWKLNQVLYREFGGRIIFQQAGWEPIDAYRKLLDRYAAKKAFVVHDPELRTAVYSYFEHKFVYADDAKARFYFEKPYWERTPEEMKAAGF